MRTIFEGIRDMPIIYFPRLILRLNSHLKENGFERVNYGKRINLNSYYNKLTLMITPSLDFPSDRDVLGDNYEITTKVVNNYGRETWESLELYLTWRKGYQGMNAYKYVERHKEPITPLFAKNKENQDVRIGDYFKDRNIVALYINIFNADLAVGDSEMIFPILEDLKKEMDRIGVAKQDVSEKMKYAMLNSFRKEMEHRVTDLDSSIRSSEGNLQQQRMSLVRTMRELEVNKRQIESLRIFSSNIDQTLKVQLEEVKKLSFVKNVRLTTKGIKMNLGRIFNKYNEKDYYIGDFAITINPEKVTVECLNPIVTDDGGEYHHPHVNGDNNCYGGERTLKIEEYLASFELKKLVYFIYLFLKSYNNEDCYNKIRLWEETPKRKKKEKEVVVGDFEEHWEGDDTANIRDENGGNREDSDEDEQDDEDDDEESDDDYIENENQ